MEEFAEDPPTSIASYTVLEISPKASQSEVRTAYKKLALRHHPGFCPSLSPSLWASVPPNSLLTCFTRTSDKALPSEQASAHTKFQEIAFAYAILSDPARRARYDATGSTADSLAGVDGDFNWSDFFRQQYADTVTLDRFSLFKSEYQHSPQETRDLLAIYAQKKGNMNAIFNTVMMSDVLDDEDRFRAIIDAAIASGEAEPFDAYVNEPAKARDQRRSRAQRERKSAEKHAKKMGIYDKVFGEDGVSTKGGQKRSKKEPDMAELAALVQSKTQARKSALMEKLEAKYVSGAKGGKKGKSKIYEEPPEEAFQQAAARMNKRKARAPTPVLEDGADEDEEEEDLEADSVAEDEGEDEEDDIAEEATEPEEEDEEEEPVPRKRRRTSQRNQIPAKRSKRAKRR